jgi:L-cysteine S-thiosulfotransferase
MRVVAWLAAALLLPVAAQEPQRPHPLRGGIEFQSPQVRAMQADDFGNPGALWITRGEALYTARCASCHGEAKAAMKGVAARHPRFDPALGRVVNLEQRIEACVTTKAKLAPIAWESEPMLALTAYVAQQSRGMPVKVAIDGPAASVYERGRQIYFERQGQLNLACHQCHDQSFGRKILHDVVSQGHPVDWPAYRLEWQSLGSLQRRLRACYFGVRAEMPPYGDPDLVAIELYLAARAEGLSSSVPGVRR